MTDASNLTPPQVEKALEFCAGILDLPRVELEDNFLDLGGDSFSAIELAARLGEIGCEIAVDDLFEAESFTHLFGTQ